jgi:hypothetical protein
MNKAVFGFAIMAAAFLRQSKKPVGILGSVFRNF